MTLKEFAERLNGIEYNGYPIFSKEDIGIAKENGFVIVTRNISTIMYNVFHTEPDGEQFMIGLIKDGVLTDTALRKMLSKMDKDTYLKNAVILKAYVINALSDIKCNFEL